LNLSPEACQTSIVSFLHDNRFVVFAGLVTVSLLFSGFIAKQIVRSTLTKKEMTLWVSVALVHLIVTVIFFTFGMFVVARCSS
jgi:hypothetical protein